MRIPLAPPSVSSDFVRRVNQVTLPGWPLLLTLATIAALPAASASAQDIDNAVDITRVEEDWRIEIGTLSPDEHAPQIITVMSPLGHLDGPYIVFEINHATYPDFAAGGMQLQKWFHDIRFGYRSFPNNRRLSTPGEVIEFTTRMELVDGDLIFEIRDGSSQTWQSFGGEGHLKARFHRLPITRLNSYRPDVSTENSRVGFASHRVKQLVLKEVRYYSSDSLNARDTTPRVVHQHLIQ